jgi:hypothetical protein
MPAGRQLSRREGNRNRCRRDLRQEHASPILTPNLPFAGWGDVFGDQVVAAGGDRPHRAPTQTYCPSKAPATGSKVPESTPAGCRAATDTTNERRKALYTRDIHVTQFNEAG